MTERMQQVVAGLGVLIVCAALWMLLVSPAREDASAAQEAQRSAEAQAVQVTAQLARSRQAAERAPANARALKRLAVAVPEQVEAAQLIDQLDRTAKRFGVTFDVLKISNGAARATATSTTSSGPKSSGAAADGTATSTTATAAATAPRTAANAPGSVPVGLSVQVSGGYVAVTRFVDAIQTTVRPRGQSVTAHGRLLRVNAIDLQVDEDHARGLSGTLDVTAYLLPRQTEASSSATATSGGQP